MALFYIHPFSIITLNFIVFIFILFIVFCFCQRFKVKLLLILFILIIINNLVWRRYCRWRLVFPTTFKRDALSLIFSNLLKDYFFDNLPFLRAIFQFLGKMYTNVKFFFVYLAFLKEISWFLKKIYVNDVYFFVLFLNFQYIFKLVYF